VVTVLYMSAVVRIADELLPYLDAAIDQVQDEFGMKRYRSRADVVNDAVKELIKKLAIQPKEADR